MSNASARFRRSQVLATAVLIGLVAAALAALAQQPAQDPLELLGTRATEGAVAGYVDDNVCANCHRAIFDSFQDVGMAQAFKAPPAARHIETFGVEYYHQLSDRYYRIDRGDDGDLTFVRYQKHNGGRPLNEISIDIDWVVGSGNRARSYLYQTDYGELFMLPLSWYSEDERWRMSPGFEYRTHEGVGRRLTRACLSCHNALPEVPEGSDEFWRAETFPHELPQGIGCQRCHGPGGDHIRAVLTGRVEQIHAAIVNPAKLSGDERDAVCFQCHLLPSATVEGVRSVGRGIYSFRPGQSLTDFIVNVDIAEQDVAPGERFEINHHAYRLTQSSCYRESAGELTCISCHNPHEKPESDAFRATSSAVCTGCHTSPAELHPPDAGVEGDCIGCHMPRRRTSDVIEVTMTDHRIARGPFDLDAIAAPVGKQDHAVTGISVFDFGDAPEGDAANLYRYLAALRANRFVAAGRTGLEQHLEEYNYDTPEPYIDLIKAQLKVGDFKAAEAEARALISRDERIASAYNLLGTALLGQGRATTAVAAIARAVEIEPDPEAYFNLAAAYLGTGDIVRADAQIDHALELRLLMGIAWRYRGLIRKAEGKPAEARAALVRALQIDPLDSAAYAELVTLLRELGDSDEAERFLELGLRSSANPALLQPLVQ